ncbi:MAG: hypothetical protein IJX07_02900 [Bacillales bacterium]|nr:hypothetical protein [Bacillales bacterium]
MFIRFHPQTFALKTMSVGALSVLTGNLVKNIFHQTVTPKHFLLALFYYTFIFLILFSVYSFRIEITEKQVTCYYSFQKKVLPIQNLRISTQHIYQGIPNPFPVHILQNGHEKIEIPYFIFGKDFHKIATTIHEQQWLYQKQKLTHM